MFWLHKVFAVFYTLQLTISEFESKYVSEMSCSAHFDDIQELPELAECGITLVEINDLNTFGYAQQLVSITSLDSKVLKRLAVLITTPLQQVQDNEKNEVR